MEHSGPLSGEIMNQTKKRKAIETVRGYKIKSKIKERPSNQCCCLMFSNTLFKKKKKTVLILGSIFFFFFAPHLTRQSKFYAPFFSKLRKFRRAALKNKPCPLPTSFPGFSPTRRAGRREPWERGWFLTRRWRNFMVNRSPITAKQFLIPQVWNENETGAEMCPAILVLWVKQQFCTCKHFFDVHYTTTRRNLPMLRFVEDVNIWRWIFLNWAVPSYFFQRRFHSLITWIARKGNLTNKPEAQRKRTQPCWPKTPNIQNIDGCYILRPFAHPVACCMLLWVVAQSLKPVKRLYGQQCRESLRPFVRCFRRTVRTFYPHPPARMSRRTWD